MAGEEVIFIDRPIDIAGNLIGTSGDGAPEVRHKAVKVIDCLYAGHVRPREQHRAGTKERFDIILRLAQARPDRTRNRPFAAKIGIRCKQIGYREILNLALIIVSFRFAHQAQQVYQFPVGIARRLDQQRLALLKLFEDGGQLRLVRVGAPRQFVVGDQVGERFFLLPVIRQQIGAQL